MGSPYYFGSPSKRIQLAKWVTGRRKHPHHASQPLPLRNTRFANGIKFRMTQVPSLVQGRKAQLAQACGVGDRVDLGNLAVGKRELEDEEQTALPSYDESYRTIHESRPRSLSASHKLLGHGSRTAHLP